MSSKDTRFPDNPQVAHTSGEHMPAQCSDPKAPNTNMALRAANQDDSITHAPSFCLHCGKKLASLGRIYPQDKRFCCAGCATVHKLIHANDLQDYYQMMTALGQNPNTAENKGQSYGDAPADVLLSLFSTGQKNSYACFVPSIVCAACCWVIEAVMSQESSISGVQVDLMRKKVTFYVDESSACDSKLKDTLQKLTDLGYAPLPLSMASEEEFTTEENRKQILRLAVAGFCFGNIMLYSSAIYLGEWTGSIEESYAKLFRYLSVAMAVPLLFYCSKPILSRAVSSLKVGVIGIDFPVAIAIVIACFASIYNWFWGESSHLYMDTLASLVFVVLFSRFLNERVLQKANSLSDSAFRLLPERGKWLKVGEEIVVAKGESLPADGSLLEGETAEINEASLTGEFQPVLKKGLEKAFAGTENIGNPFSMKVENLAEETRVGQIQKVLEKAKQNQNRYATLAQKAVKYFALMLLLSAVGNLVVRLAFGLPDPFLTTAAVLVIGCPCALAFGVPLASALSLKSLWTKGIFAKTEAALDTCREVTQVVVDKTGTLTKGQFEVRSWNENRSLSVQEMGALWLGTGQSRHPLSKALTKHFGEKLEQVALESGEALTASSQHQSLSIEEATGKGLLIDSKEGVSFCVGKKEFCVLSFAKNCTKLDAEKFDQFCAAKEKEMQKSQTFEVASSILFLRSSSGYFACLRLDDEPREGIKDFLDFIHEYNLQLEILSGDSSISVARFRSYCEGLCPELRIAATGGLSPKEKLERVEELQAKGAKVLMMGDGVNDAAALAAADVGVAAHGGVDLALSSADVSLVRPDLGGLKRLFNAATVCERQQKRVLATSLAYNLIAIVAACLGFVHPAIAALLMPLSSISVYFVARVDS